MMASCCVSQGVLSNSDVQRISCRRNLFMPAKIGQEWALCQSSSQSILLSAQRLSIVLVSPVLLWEEARWQWALQRCSRLVFEIFLGVQQPCRR